MDGASLRVVLRQSACQNAFHLLAALRPTLVARCVMPRRRSVAAALLAYSFSIVAVGEMVFAEVDFQRDVAPILEAHCLRCHKPGNEKGDVSLATAAALTESGAVARGDSKKSPLLSVIRSESPGKRPDMPKEGDPLSAEQVDLIRAWIDAGADWPEGITLRERSQVDGSWWSLQPVAEVTPPELSDLPVGWGRNPIDRFILAKLHERGLSPSPPADRRVLIRRATYDLTGLPPTPEEVQAFLDDRSADAWEKVIARLLDSPHYGERWGRHWLDVVRFGESNGFERNVIIDTLWPFRDYVIRSFNEDKPFDRLIREHLAGDQLGPGDPAVEIGTAFLVCGPYDNVGNQDPVQAAQIRANTIDEMIRATSESFLGLTAGCARCHDHKFDPILQEDYYALYATLAGVTHGTRTIATPEQNQQRAAKLKPLNETLANLKRQDQELSAAITARAESRAEELASGWTREPISRYGTEETFAPISAQHLRLVVLGRDDRPDQRTGFTIDEFEVYGTDDPSRNVAAARNGGTADGDSRVAPDFDGAYGPELTIDGRFGARWLASSDTLTLHFGKPESISRVVFSSDRRKSLGMHGKTNFVGEYRIEVSVDGETWREVASSLDRKPTNDAHRKRRLYNAAITDAEQQQLARTRRQIRQTERSIAAVPAPPIWWIGRFGTPPASTHVFVGGDPQKPGPAVTPASLSTLQHEGPAYALAEDAAEPQRRMALADWIADPSNPLTPRVLVNRVWQHHFGRGIVATPSDFGAMGVLPTHPQLLDWLARQWVLPDAQGGCGYRLKPLHRLIMQSQAYQQSSTALQSGLDADAECTLLWRFPPRRLGAEEIRDTILSISGKLDTRPGGPGFRLYEYQQDNVATYVPLETHGPETYRRAVYHQNARAMNVDLMTEFDCPDPAFAAPRRNATTTPLQALTLLNHSFSIDMAAAFAERLSSSGQSPGGRIERAYRLAYGRPPSDDELAAASRFVTQHNLRALCRAILNSNELITVE